MLSRLTRALAHAGLLAALACAPADAQLTVARVIDGDTFELSDGRRVRLIGIDTPEVHPSPKLRRDAERSGQDAATIRALGRRASEHAKALVARRSVELEYDPANAATRHEDRYGRTLAYVWVLDDDGRRAFLANGRLVADGYAVAYTRYPFSRMDEFRALEREAREAGRGLWEEEP